MKWRNKNGRQENWFQQPVTWIRNTDKTAWTGLLNSYSKLLIWRNRHNSSSSSSSSSSSKFISNNTQEYSITKHKLTI